MGYQEEQKRLDRLAEVTDIAVQADTEVNIWLARHPEVKNILANKNIIFQYFNRDLEDISADPGESLDQAYEHPKLRESLAHWPNEEDEKQELSDRIIELLRHGTSPITLEAERKKHKYMSVVALRIAAASLADKAEMRKRTPDELREIIRRPQPGFQELPPLYRNRSMLLTLEPAQLRHFIKMYGSDNINAVLAKKD